MILKSDSIAELLSNPSADPLVVTPQPDLTELKNGGSGALDLRLGTWFVALRESRSSLLSISPQSDPTVLENRLTSRWYVPFGEHYVLHPRCFVLGVTMEWIR